MADPASHESRVLPVFLARSQSISCLCTFVLNLWSLHPCLLICLTDHSNQLFLLVLLFTRSLFLCSNDISLLYNIIECVEFSSFIYQVESQQYSQYLHPFKIWFAINHWTVPQPTSSIWKGVAACLYVHVSTFRYSGSGFMALSLRDTEWQQSHRHLVLRHSSSPPLTACGRPRQLGRHMLVLQVVCLSEICEALCIDLCAFYLAVLVVVCVLIVPALSRHLCVCVHALMWRCSDVRCECWSLLCLSLCLWLWQPPCPPRSCCHMLAASVRAEQKPWLHRDSRLCVFELLTVELL